MFNLLCVFGLIFYLLEKIIACNIRYQSCLLFYMANKYIKIKLGHIQSHVLLWQVRPSIFNRKVLGVAHLDN